MVIGNAVGSSARDEEAEKLWKHVIYQILTRDKNYYLRNWKPNNQILSNEGPTENRGFFFW